MYPTSDSSSLTTEQLNKLDATFFGSNPASYWRARIDDLLRDLDQPLISDQVTSNLGRFGVSPELLAATEPSRKEREAQRALDAHSLRQHLAESLVRLVHASIVGSPAEGHCIWTTLTDNMQNTFDVVQDLHKFQTNHEIPAGLFLPDANLQHLPPERRPEMINAVGVHWRWVQRAMSLLASDGLDANVGYNKLKHGLAIRAHDELRVTFVAGEAPADGTVALSDIQAGLNIIDTQSMEFIQKLPNKHAYGGSWEVTVMNLHFEPMIAESIFMSVVWASVFKSAAAKHRSNGDPVETALLAGPSPGDLPAGVVGYRQALTLATRSEKSRGLVVETPDGLLPIEQTGPGMEAVIVDR